MYIIYFNYKYNLITVVKWNYIRHKNTNLFQVRDCLENYSSEKVRQ